MDHNALQLRLQRAEELVQRVEDNIAFQQQMIATLKQGGHNRDLMAVYGLRHSLRSLFRVMTRSLFLASSTALMSTAVEFAMRAEIVYGRAQPWS